MGVFILAAFRPRRPVLLLVTSTLILALAGCDGKDAAHADSVAVSAEFERPITVEAARAVLLQAPGLDVVDDPANKKYPMPLDVSGRYNCAVGRLRMDCALDNGLCFWVAGDQLLKGAALNAVQIAEELMK